MLKRKWLDRKEVSTRILEQRFKFIERNDKDFNGYISLLHLDKVYKTLIAPVCGKDRCLLKNGHTWLSWFEKDKHYCVVAIFDENENLIEWYVDVLLNQGIDDDGIPYYDDLYLDVVVFPTDGTSTFLDEDELLDALNDGTITKADYDLAYEVGNYLLNRYSNNIEDEISHTLEMLEYFKKHTV